MGEKRLTLAVFNESTGWSLPESLVERVRAGVGGGVTVGVARSRAELLAALEGTDWLVGLPLTEDEFMAHAARVQWVQLAQSMGDATEAVSAAVKTGLRVSGAGPARAPLIAEHAIAVSLVLLRRLDVAWRLQSEHSWSPSRLSERQRGLSGARVALLAIEPVRSELRRLLEAFGATALAPEAPDDPAPWGDTRWRQEALALADVVVVCVPRLPATVGLLSKRTLASCRPDAYLVDVSRGGVVEAPALLEALRRGRLGGAALDVFETEPLPATSPLWTMPNVLVTPHVSGASPGYWTRVADLVVENAGRLSSGGALLGELPAPWYAPVR